MARPIANLMAEILRVLADVRKPGITSAEIAAKIGGKFERVDIQKAISNAVIRGQLDFVEPNGVRTKRVYTLSAEGKERYKMLDQIPIKLYVHRGKKKRKSNQQTNKAITVTEAAPAADSLPVNISLEANNFADYASVLVAQNAEYRAVLQQVYHTIGTLLYPPKPTANKEK